MNRTSVTHGDAATLNERVACLVPGFAGYDDSGGRADADGRVRVEMCERIDGLTARLEDFLLDMSEYGWHPGMQGVDRTIRRLDDLRDELAGGVGVIARSGSTRKLEPARCEPVLKADLALLYDLESFGEYLEDIGRPQFKAGHLRKTLASLDDRMRAIEDSSQRRVAAVQGMASA